jgi:hypothetical protein
MLSGIDSRTARRILEPKRQAAAVDWRKLHTENVHNCASLSIKNVTSRSVRCADYLNSVSVLTFSFLRSMLYSVYG